MLIRRLDTGVIWDMSEKYYELHKDDFVPVTFEIKQERVIKGVPDDEKGNDKKDGKENPIRDEKRDAGEDEKNAEEKGKVRVLKSPPKKSTSKTAPKKTKK